MSSGQEGNSSINDELFHLYIEYQLCKVKKDVSSLWETDAAEKNALMQILIQCQQISGDTLRSVMTDIFENSVAKFGDNRGPMVVHQAPHTNTNRRNPQVIASTTEDDDNDTDSEAIRDVETRSAYTATHCLSDRKDTNFDNAAVSIRNILSSSVLRRKLKKETQTQKERAMEKHILEDLLSKGNKAEMHRMLSQVGRTKAMLRERIYATLDTVTVNVSSTIKGTFSVLPYGSCPGTSERNMSRCQENLLGYQFGKLVERLKREYSEREAANKAKMYYKELQHELKRQHRTYHTVPWSMFINYTDRTVRCVNEFGIYCLFIPEVIGPTKFKRTHHEEFMVLLRHVDASYSVFKNIVQLGREGNIIAPHGREPSDGRMMNKVAFGKRVSRY